MQSLDDLKYIDRLIDESLQKTTDDPFHFGKAILFGIQTFIGETPMTIPIAMDADVYDMLASVEYANDASAYSSFGIVTCGWAAPIEDGSPDDNSLPPSQHPRKRRVRLFTMFDDGKVYSSIRFEDAEEIVYDENEATGSLAAAMQEFALVSQTLAKLKHGLND